MLVVFVHVKVLPGSADAFKKATAVNARESLLEPGIARFDVLQHEEDDERFVLVEAFRSPEAVAAHKKTAHYAEWRDAVAPLMAEPRRRMKYESVFPEESEW